MSKGNWVVDIEFTTLVKPLPCGSMNVITQIAKYRLPIKILELEGI